MAAGFPVKANYATGDVLTATNMNDLSGSVNLLQSSQYGAGKNVVINGGFDIWQRGTANTTTASVYTADRWQKGAATSYGISRQTTSDTTNLPTIQYCARSQRTNGSAVTTANELGYSIESVNSTPYAGQAVILSFYARAGANMTNSNALVSAIYSGTGTDQNIMTTGLTGQATVATSTKTLTTTWQRFTVTGTIGATATQIALYFSYTPTGTASTNDYYEITGVQLELGSNVTTFSRAGGTIQGELAACERYFQIVTGQMCSGSNSTTVYSGLNFRTQMRTGPTVALSAAMTITDAGADYSQSSASVSIVSSRANSQGVQISMPNFTSITTHRPYSTTITASQIQLSAEL